MEGDVARARRAACAREVGSAPALVRRERAAGAGDRESTTCSCRRLAVRQRGRRTASRAERAPTPPAASPRVLGARSSAAACSAASWRGAPARAALEVGRRDSRHAPGRRLGRRRWRRRGRARASPRGPGREANVSPIRLVARSRRVVWRCTCSRRAVAVVGHEGEQRGEREHEQRGQRVALRRDGGQQADRPQQRVDQRDRARSRAPGSCGGTSEHSHSRPPRRRSRSRPGREGGDAERARPAPGRRRGRRRARGRPRRRRWRRRR